MKKLTTWGVRLGMGVFAAALPVATSAIIIRHDVPDEKYRKLGEDYRATFVDIAVPRRNGDIGPGNGNGALVAPQWVVTAAHVAASIKPGHPLSRVTGAHSVMVDGKPYVVEQVFLHPDWQGELSGPDIGLIKLAQPVAGSKPACLYRSADEGGKVATVVGTGDTGTGLTGPRPGSNVLRGATILVDEAPAGEPLLTWTFHKAGDPGVTPLEGISGPGDSGGPAFLIYNGKLCVAGISSAGDGMGRGPGRYGAREFYTRVSTFRPWLESVMADPERD